MMVLTYADCLLFISKCLTYFIKIIARDQGAISHPPSFSHLPILRVFIRTDQKPSTIENGPCSFVYIRVTGCVT